MARDDRKQQILGMLEDRGSVEVEALAQQFSVSKMTIHRDLDDLESEGVLRKIRGGATIEAGIQFESDFRFRTRQDSDAKDAVARAAMELVEPGMTVMLADGTTTAALGAMLIEKRPITAITNNAAIMDSLRSDAGINLIALGGRYSGKYNGYFGVLAEQSLASLRSDIAFITAPAVSGSQVFHMDGDVVRTKRAMLRAAAKSCLLVLHRQFDRVALHMFADLSEFDWIIVDRLPESNICDELAARGIKLTVAGEPL
ncbi:DeoR family transcriptional regulator [Sphingopyxis sp. Root214]|uniref:DeoR/GlpR family DNA-binding transcription regulator n=1 Tax=unclassified Sphingopyxis TaxID=2614943 RepID=UPI0006F267DC|nr:MULTISPECIES: DeoR/GlpR family DNA-binding transcription regulator [unclassified Sphingopyxis]KQZ76687.1 DeoR family transcriptional regulator [Sphingopyxis sp. Root154]KRC09426.1 DeoR family transcriptional regulator [Sphingopyxis sp. Root214]